MQKIKIECDLNFRGNKINNNTIHCTFNANLIPLSVFIFCEQYELAYDKNEYFFILNTHRLSPKEIINFKIKYYNINLKSKFKIFLESMPNKNNETENETDKPNLIINSEENIFSLEIPGYPEYDNFQKIKRLKCSLSIFLTEKLLIKIIIDANIIPFDFP